MMGDPKRARNRKRGNKPRVDLHITAPVFYSTLFLTRLRQGHVQTAKVLFRMPKFKFTRRIGGAGA